MSDQDQHRLQYELFELAMLKEWGQVVKKYEDQRAHTIKLTKSEDTAFNIAISSYNSKTSPKTSHQSSTEELIRLMKERRSLPEVLKMKNAKGDTPLHLAAAVGWEVICESIAREDRELSLIEIRNEKGETPLFVAAHHGNLEAFCKLHEIYVKGRNWDESLSEPLCRRKDGNTVLHSAISGEYFRLAHLIVRDYKNLVNYVNVDGETALHVLARKPNVFRSSSSLGFYESIIYQVAFVDHLKPPKHNSRAYHFPRNHWTCVNIFYLFWDPIYECWKAGKKRRSASTDEENQPYVEYGVPSKKLDCCSRSKKQNGVPGQENVENQTKSEREKRKYDGSLPPNCTTWVSIFKFAATVLLTILGIGFSGIKKIQEIKVKHSHAMELLNKMVECQSSYIYGRNGQRPAQEFEPLRLVEVPDTQPHFEDQETHHNPEANDQQKDDNKKDQNQLGETKSGKETPIFVAAKMGISEIVKKIICSAPVAIQDQDSEGKNVLMLAAENRHTNVFIHLLLSNPPDYLFHHVDNEGNNILHLAAKLGLKEPWRIPGNAFQMVCEIKWYKLVENLFQPLGFSHHNKNGETPMQIFTRTHENLLKSGNEWLIKTSESCSVVAALIATVAFATSATVPGGLDQTSGYPVLRNKDAFDIFSITSLLALCLSITALVCFLAILTSRVEEIENLSRKLLMGLSCLLSSIAAMLLSFCAGHTFILREKLTKAAVPLYAATILPVMYVMMAQLPLYFDLVWAVYLKVPQRNYKVFHQ